MRTIKGYKFIQKDMKSKNGKDTKWVLNRWKKHKGKLKLCKSGYHACRTALQSLNYVYGERWFIVEARGDIIDEDDKFVAREMRLLKEIPTKKIAVEFGIKCVWHVLKNYENKYSDDRPRKAIMAAKAYLKKPCDDTQKAELAAWSARSAALSAALSAGWSARSAALSAAESAAWSAESAAWSARSAAKSAVWSAEIKWQEKTLYKLTKKAILDRKSISTMSKK